MRSRQLTNRLSSRLQLLPCALWISLVLAMLLPGGLALAAEPSLQCHIRFVDDPPYEHSWLPWKDDHFRIAFDIENKSDSTYAILRSTPCSDCNPEIFLQEAETGKPAETTRQMDILYILDDRSFNDLPPGRVYSGTIDFAKYIDYDLDRGKTYSVWLVFRADYSDYEFRDTTRTTPIWPHDIVSDTLTFEF